MGQMDDCFDNSYAHLMDAERMLDDAKLRNAFESWIRVHAPIADFTRGIRGEYIVRHMQGEWEAFVQGFVRGVGSDV